MNKLTPAIHPICNLLPKEVEGFDSQVELALYMRWSWNHATDEVWRSLDPVLWELQLKAASDQGVPVIGIGLLYQQGYFRQEIDKDGALQALYPYNDPGQLPITPLRQPNGEWLRLKIELPG